MQKNILIVDDSALMRRVFCDIIGSDERFRVAAMAANGREALKLLEKNTYDAVVLDLVMPKVNGIEMLREIQKRGWQVRVLVCSTIADKDAAETVEALSLGAIDFVRKPTGFKDLNGEEFRERFLRILEEVANAEESTQSSAKGTRRHKATSKVTPGERKGKGKNQLVAIASSTGGPKALHEVIPRLPKDLDAPVVLVQHMPKGFTKTLAERLDQVSALKVVEAAEGMRVEKGCVYVSQGGLHMTLTRRPGGGTVIAYSDAPTREGVKPCANYMYESIGTTDYDEVTCVVLTGMGADGSEGIVNLGKSKSIHVIAQNKETCAVYGMPRSAVATGLTNEELPLSEIADAITKYVGVM
ncbi:MAG: chemotaxis-specific protein-glutamate methyltransferase CheB [Lachnospiraceae bacterium]|nr:chemotaxis-specific protein-glutamate methyltransferase CheB [Lachnospiraceae bacterium]